MSMKWTFESIPELNGKVAVVTGANSGIGFETAKALAEKGATVVMACRNLTKANTAADAIRRDVPEADLEIIRIDLADLASVHAFAEDFQARHDRLDLLVNNAGVMVPPYTTTTDGFELQFGANHLGHFALTGLLLETLTSTPGARVVNVSSGAHRFGAINFDDLNWEQGYNPMRAYSQSKLANLLFTLELNHRLAELGTDTIATAAHPGWTLTGLQRGPAHLLSRVIGQSADVGALPTLRAAVDPSARSNDYYGPDGLMEMRGYPKRVNTSAAARDAATAQRLWAVSEEMTGVAFA